MASTSLNALTLDLPDMRIRPPRQLGRNATENSDDSNATLILPGSHVRIMASEPTVPGVDEDMSSNPIEEFEEGIAEVQEPTKKEGIAEVQEPTKKEGIAEVQVQEPTKEEGIAEVQEPGKEEGIAEVQDPEPKKMKLADTEGRTLPKWPRGVLQRP